MTKLEKVISNLEYLKEQMEDSNNKEILKGEIQELKHLEDLLKNLI